MKTLQPTKQNDMVATNNDSKVSKNERTTNEDKNKQIRQQIKIQNEHLGNINKIEKLKKRLDSVSTMKRSRTLVNQALNIRKSNK